MPDCHQLIKSQTHWLRYVAALAAVIALIAAHGAILQFLAAHTPLSLAVILPLGGLIAIKHLGMIGPAYAALRRHFRREP